MGELKPCPFCGSPAELERDSDHHGQWFNLGCSRHWGKGHDDKCVAGRLWYTETDTPEADAITAWNTRPRTEGRGEGEPVASEDQANHDCPAKRRPGEPMFIILGRDPDGHNIVRSWAERRLAAGGDPEHCEMGLATAERMRLYASDPANAPASAPPASAYASPIREPEISREAVEAPDEIEMLRIFKAAGCRTRADYAKAAAKSFADAILNLAPVAKGVSHDADLSDEFDRPGRLSDATRHSAEGAADPALSGTRGVVTPVGGRGEEAKASPFLSFEDSLDRLVIYTAMEDGQLALNCERVIKAEYERLLTALQAKEEEIQSDVRAILALRSDLDALQSALAEALGVLRPFARVYDELCGRGLSYAISGDDGVIYADDDNFADASDLVQRFSTGRVDGVEL